MKFYLHKKFKQKENKALLQLKNYNDQIKYKILQHLKSNSNNDLKGMKINEHAFLYLPLIRLKNECNKTIIKQFFLPTKHDKIFIKKEYEFLDKKEASHHECIKLKNTIKKRSKLLFIDLDKPKEKNNDDELSK